MWGGALFVLLIGCVNVANLALVRSRVRLKELATRLALGAGTTRIARQLAVEHLLLALGIGTLSGIAIGYVALLSMDAHQPAGTAAVAGHRARHDRGRCTRWRRRSRSACARPDTGLRRCCPPTSVGVLREEGRTATSGRGAQSLRRALVVAQVGCAFVLLIGAGLLFASFRKVLAVDPGFTTGSVLTGAVSLPESRYADGAALRRFTDEALRRARALPGVSAAGVTDSLPLGNSASASAILAEGYQTQPGESFLAPSEVRVSAGYFETIGARLVAGRFVTDRDAATSPRVVVIDDRLARRFWPNQNPIGRRMYRPSDDGDDLAAVTEKTEFLTVVGVVAEMKLRNLTDGDKLVGAYFIPLAQEPQSDLTFVLRTAGDTPALSSALRREIAAVDSQLPVFEMQPMSYWVDRSLASAARLRCSRSPSASSHCFCRR